MLKMFEKKYDQEEIIESVNKKNIIIRAFTLVIGTLCSALAFNLFFVPQNFVSAGLAGIAVILVNFLDVSAQTIVLIGNIVLLIVCLLTLGWKKSLKTLIGTSIYILFIYLTKDVVSLLNFSFDNVLLYVLAAGVVLGIGESLVYKVGYNTGGTSIIALVLNKYNKQPIGKLVRNIGYVIIIAGCFTFGYTAIMYSLIILTISTILIDRVLIGISDSKMLMVHTNKDEEVKNFIMEVIESGVTEFESKGGYSKRRNKILMCVVPTDKYSYLTAAIKEIDDQAFIIVSDCYEVLGGTKKGKKYHTTKKKNSV